MKAKDKTDYDAIVVFQRPIIIKDDHGDGIRIYGIMYDSARRHADDMWTWELNRFLAYLLACEKVQENKGKLAPEMFITAKGNVIPLRIGVKNLVYRIMKEEMIGYRIIEPKCPIEVMTSETEDIFILSSKLINRYASTYEKKIIEIRK